MSPAKKTEKSRTLLKRLTLAALIIGCLSIIDQAAYSQKISRTVELKIGSGTLKAHVAESSEQRIKGLSGLQELNRDEGMLFVYEKPGKLAFHMKDVRFPLSIAFLDPSGKILTILPMDPGSENRLYMSPAAAQYALEANQGWFQTNNVRPGDSIDLGILQI